MNKYPRTEKYDAEFVEENWMGPNPLMLAEELCANLKLEEGMKVLDMGCGKGITSIFLAKEFGVTVFANDLWTDPAENWERFKAAGTADKVFPMKADARALPYAKGFFDAVVSIDSYHYFGADETYFPRVFSKLARPGGQIGIACPGLAREFEKGYPETHKAFWNEEMFSFHSAEWWKALWAKTETADITACYNIPDPKALWYPWARWAKANLGFNDVEFLDADTEDQITLFILTAVKIK
ncbi:MAG: methyltransferase domain-containing protein [Treponema sp.]|nr:methyltransferase domain-containing protein [Treponema sp.]